MRPRVHLTTSRLNPRANPGVWVSAAAHGALLAAGLVAFTATKLPEAQEGIPVEILTDNQMSEITRGETNAAKVQPVPSPRVDRQAETRVERDPGEAKQDAPAPPKRPAEVKIAQDEAEPAPAPAPPKRPEVAKVEPPPPPPPSPPSRPDTARADAARADAARQEAAKAEAQRVALREEAEETARVEKAEADRARTETKAKADRIAAAAKAKQEAEAKAEAERRIREAELKTKAEADAKAKADERRKIAEAKARADAKARAEQEARARRQAEAADQFSPGDISRLLASRAPSQSSGSTGREIQKTASLGAATGTAGAATGTAQRMNPSQRDQIAGLIREQLIRCWQPPVAVQSAQKPPTAVIRLGLRQDGSLLSEPSIMNTSSDPLFRPVADSALRATRRCAPLRIPAQFAPFYQDWKDLVVDFDPREMGVMPVDRPHLSWPGLSRPSRS